MATFKEAFAAARKEKGAGKTFMWQGKSYSTDRADDKKQAALATGTKPKAKPAGLNSASGAAPKVSSAAKRPAKAAEISGQKAAPSLSGASRSVAGKVAPKMSMMEKAKADAKAAREKSRAVNKPKVTATTKTTTKPTANKPFQKLRDILSGGGFSKYKG